MKTSFLDAPRCPTPPFCDLTSGECVRLRNFVVGAELRDNEIYDCGVYDFRFNSKGKNGEAFYIGTASELVCTLLLFWCER